MFDSAAPATLADQLPADAYGHLIQALRLALPPPPAKAGATDEAEALLRRDNAAIAAIAALAPANAVEAELAAQFVAASEHWKHHFRQAELAAATPEREAKCRAEARAMMRQANSVLRLLLKMQALRQKREADRVACDRAAWTEHCAIGLMAQALAPAPKSEPAAPAASTRPDTAASPAPAPQPPLPPAREPAAAPACAGPVPEADAAQEHAAMPPDPPAADRAGPSAALARKFPEADAA